MKAVKEFQEAEDSRPQESDVSLRILKTKPWEWVSHGVGDVCGLCEVQTLTPAVSTVMTCQVFNLCAGATPDVEQQSPEFQCRAQHLLFSRSVFTVSFF